MIRKSPAHVIVDPEVTEVERENAQYLAFVKQHPEWRRDRAKPLLTAAKLSELARERKLDAQWTLAAASDADARALAAVLGVKLRKLASGEFAHGSTIVVLDREGRPIAHTDALGHRTPLLRALVAINKRSGSRDRRRSARAR